MPDLYMCTCEWDHLSCRDVSLFSGVSPVLAATPPAAPACGLTDILPNSVSAACLCPIPQTVCLLLLLPCTVYTILYNTHLVPLPARHCCCSRIPTAFVGFLCGRLKQLCSPYYPNPSHPSPPPNQASLPQTALSAALLPWW